MAKITAVPTIELKLTFTISEAEARALDGLTGYGDDAFIKAFKEKLGAYYIENHEAALREFLKTTRQFCASYLASVDSARKCFNQSAGVEEGK